MKFLYKGKDGGPYSTVTGYWLFEIKRLFSIALLKFEHGSRDQYHSHAFDSVSWVLKGSLREEYLNYSVKFHKPSFLPIITRRWTFHRVFSLGTTWVLTFRGPWDETWEEYDPTTREWTVLTEGRQVVATKKIED